MALSIFNTGIAIFSTLMIIFMGWAMIAVGLGAKLNLLFGVLILSVMIALVWNFFQIHITIILILLQICCLMAIVGGWISYVKKSPSIIDSSQAHDR